MLSHSRVCIVSKMDKLKDGASKFEEALANIGKFGSFFLNLQLKTRRNTLALQNTCLRFE